MSVENLKKMAQLAQDDPKVRERFKGIGLSDLDGLMAYAKELNLEFTREDVQALNKEVVASSPELSEEDLEKVAGGVATVTSMAVVGAVVGLVALGVSILGLGVQVGSEASTNW